MMAEVIAESLIDRQQIQNEVIQELGLDKSHPLSQEDIALFEAAYREKLRPAMNTAKLVVASVMASLGHDPSIAIVTSANALENNFTGVVPPPEYGPIQEEIAEGVERITLATGGSIIDTAYNIYDNPDEFVEGAVLDAIPYGDIVNRLNQGEYVGKYEYPLEALMLASGTKYAKVGGEVALKTAKKFGANFTKRLNDTKRFRNNPANKNTIGRNIEALDLAETGKKLIHKNSLEYTGPTHIYKITNPQGNYKIGESAQGLNKYGQSKRAEAQARQLRKETKLPHETQILAVVEGKREARRVETSLIQVIKEEGGNTALPGNKGMH